MENQKIIAEPVTPPVWLSTLFPETTLNANDVVTKMEIIAALWGIISAGILFLLFVILLVILLIVTSVSNNALITLCIIALLVSLWNGKSTWSTCRTGYKVIVPPSYQGVLTVAGSRVQILLLEGSYVFPNIRLPLGIAAAKFVIGAVNVPMFKVTYDFENLGAMSKNLGGMKLNGAVGIRTRSGAKYVFLRSQYTDGQAKNLIIDEVNTAFGITTKKGTAREYAGMDKDGNAKSGKKDFLNKKLHQVLHSQDFSDMRKEDDDSPDLYHTKLGVFVSPYFTSHSWLNSKTAESVEEVTRTDAKVLTMRMKMEIVQETSLKLKEAYGDISGEEARRITMIMMDEFSEEKIHDFFGMMGPEQTMQLVERAMTLLGVKPKK